MKKIIAGLTLLLFAVAASAQSITVRSEQAPDIDFNKYKTFGWASQVSNQLDAGIYFLNDLVLKAQVRDAVKGELLGLGYQMAEDQSQPDMIVNFRVFDQPVKIVGAEGYGDDYWSTGSTVNASDQYGPISNQTYDVPAGTLLLSLADRTSGKVIWQGFASGLIDNNQFIKDEGKIHEAVNMIFNEYNQRAKEYTRK